MTPPRTLAWSLQAVLAVLLASATAFAEPRSPKVAGKFYPDDRAELEDVVRFYLDRQQEPSASQKPRVLIVPHAGYEYSAVVAAAAYRQLEGHRYDGVVVVGFTHRMQFEGVSVDTVESYDTPLGELPVHQEAVAILQSYPGITHMEAAHAADEHSLEVQLPFVQVLLRPVRIVPILMGNARLEDAEHLAEALAGLSRLGDYLFVFSTDLSHYHPYSQAESIDEETVNAIVGETPEAVHRLFQRGLLEACGRGPIVASLALATKLGYLKRELLLYANSGDTSGNPASVVGYASMAMYDPPPAPGAERISRPAGEALVKAARLALENHFRTARAGTPPNLKAYPELARTQGIFVTLWTRKAHALRGCIGRIETTEPLHASVAKVALDAALRDSRFKPVTAEELPELDVEVSVLTPRAKLPDPQALVAGRDGVVLEHQGRHGLFLPQVWDETGWTRVEFLRELASQKAGLPPDAWQQATLYTFQDQVFAE